MPRWHSDLHKRRRTGGKIRSYRSRRKRERGSPSAETIVGPQVLKVRRTSGNSKSALRQAEYVNVCDPHTGVKKRMKITRVVENPANRDYDRRKVITRGAVVETELGEARVTSRPGQHGILNAVLVKAAKK